MITKLLTPTTEKTSSLKTIFRFLLGLFLLFTGISHLSFARVDFLAQVPRLIPLEPDLVVILSGIVEIFLGTALLVLPKYRVLFGWVTAAFFIAIFPGNIAQFMNGIDAFGLNSDLTRGIRLLFQPVLVLWALWSSGAWRAWRDSRVKNKKE